MLSAPELGRLVRTTGDQIDGRAVRRQTDNPERAPRSLEDMAEEAKNLRPYFVGVSLPLL